MAEDADPRDALANWTALPKKVKPLYFNIDNYCLLGISNFMAPCEHSGTEGNGRLFVLERGGVGCGP